MGLLHPRLNLHLLCPLSFRLEFLQLLSSTTCDSTQQGHPAPPPVGHPPAFHPLVGTRLNLPATSTANQARLASASSSIPRQVSLPQRGRRRTAALLPPILPRTAPKATIDQCFISDAPVPTIRMVVRVFPALVCILNFDNSFDRQLISIYLG
jgi:hypothetical protein